MLGHQDDPVAFAHRGRLVIREEYVVEGARTSTSGQRQSTQEIIPDKGELSAGNGRTGLCQVDYAGALEVRFALSQVFDVIICDQGITLPNVFAQLRVLRERINAGSPALQCRYHLTEDILEKGGQRWHAPRMVFASGQVGEEQLQRSQVRC